MLRRVSKQAKRSGAALLLLSIIVGLPLVALVRHGLGIATLFGDSRSVITTQLLTPGYSTIAPFDEPLLTITFDDGWESIYSNGLPILQRHNVRTTQYVLSGVFDDPLYMSENQVQSLQQSGHDIASHTVDHPDLTALSPLELGYQLTTAKADLNAKFGAVVDFASPLNAYSETTLAEIKQHYRSHRNTNANLSAIDSYDVNTRESFNIYNIVALTITQHTTTTELELLITYAKAHNAWIVLNYHQIDESNTRYAVTPQEFDTQLRTILASGIKMPTIREVLDVLSAGEQR